MSTGCSKAVSSLANFLVDTGYLKKVTMEKSGEVKKNLIIVLKYGAKGLPAISKIKRISRPGRRIYSTADHIPFTLSGKGVTIVSTSLGLMSDHKARKNNLGGEIICQIY